MFMLNSGVRALAATIKTALPQRWTSAMLMERYGAKDWAEVKYLFELHLEIKLGDPRTARVPIRTVMLLDAALEDQSPGASEIAKLAAPYLPREPRRKPGRPRLTS